MTLKIKLKGWRMTTNSKNHLSQNFYTAPKMFAEYAFQTMTVKEWKETALYTGGQILACGEIWSLVAKRIAPGIYNVGLKRKEFK